MTATESIRSKVKSALREEEPRETAPRKVRKRKLGTDKFWIDPDIIPDGVTYEWKRQTVLGYEDPGYQVELAENGWEPVMAERHPHYMPPGYSGPITRDGMILMERPAYLTAEARHEEMQAARDLVAVKEQQLRAGGGVPDKGLADTDHVSARRATKVAKSYEPMPVED